MEIRTQRSSRAHPLYGKRTEKKSTCGWCSRFKLYDKTRSAVTFPLQILALNLHFLNDLKCLFSLGWLNDLFSSNLFQVISRISNSMLLIHPLVTRVFILSSNNAIFVSAQLIVSEHKYSNLIKNLQILRLNLSAYVERRWLSISLRTFVKTFVSY